MYCVAVVFPHTTSAKNSSDSLYLYTSLFKSVSTVCDFAMSSASRISSCSSSFSNLQNIAKEYSSSLSFTAPNFFEHMTAVRVFRLNFDLKILDFLLTARFLDKQFNDLCDASMVALSLQRVQSDFGSHAPAILKLNAAAILLVFVEYQKRSKLPSRAISQALSFIKGSRNTESSPFNLPLKFLVVRFFSVCHQA